MPAPPPQKRHLHGAATAADRPAVEHSAKGAEGATEATAAGLCGVATVIRATELPAAQSDGGAAQVRRWAPLRRPAVAPPHLWEVAAAKSLGGSGRRRRRARPSPAKPAAAAVRAAAGPTWAEKRGTPAPQPPAATLAAAGRRACRPQAWAAVA